MPNTMHGSVRYARGTASAEEGAEWEGGERRVNSAAAIAQEARGHASYEGQHRPAPARHAS